MAEVLPHNGQQKQWPTLVTEGVLLALSPGVAYAIAFAYEAGYADHFGYPRFLIDVSLPNVLLSWGAVAYLVGLLVGILFVAGWFVPRAAAALRHNRTILRLGAALVVGIAGWFAMWPKDKPWHGLAMMVLAGVALSYWLIEFGAYYRRTSTGALSSRLESASKLLSSEQKERHFVPDSLSLAALQHPLLGRPLRIVLVVVFAMWCTFLAVRVVGEWSAGLQRNWLVCGSQPELVAVARHDAQLIAMPLRRSDLSLVRRYHFIATTDSSVAWVSRRLGPLRVLPPAAR